MQCTFSSTLSGKTHPIPLGESDSGLWQPSRIDFKILKGAFLYLFDLASVGNTVDCLHSGIDLPWASRATDDSGTKRLFIVPSSKFYIVFLVLKTCLQLHVSCFLQLSTYHDMSGAECLLPLQYGFIDYIITAKKSRQLSLCKFRLSGR